MRMMLGLAVMLFASGFALAARLTAREFHCSVPVKTITYVRDIVE